MSRLTKTLIENEPPGNKPKFLWDSQQPGFGVKILPSGKRKYVLKYRTKGGGRRAQQRWYLIGTHGAITLDQARNIARQVHGAVADGKDPQGQKLSFRNADTMEELWKRFERDHLSYRKESTAQHYKQIWRMYVKPAMGSKKVIDVSRDDVYRLHRRMAKRPYQANRAIAVLSKMFNLAERWGLRPDGMNPCRHVEKYREKSRERFLNTDELRRLGKALKESLAAQTETPHMVAAIQLLLLTGARLSEILGARWEWVDWDSLIIRLPDSKTGAKLIYLSETAIKVLDLLRALPQASENPYIIAGRVAGKPLSDLRHPWYRIRERAGLNDVRLHDLRHTTASIGVAQGMNLPVIGRLLGHTQASTTQRYAHVDVDPALKAANKIGDVISGALDIQKH
ncbi:MAG: tyrosine-type recombinase/integrase [Rhodospirillales bacterium]